MSTVVTFNRTTGTFSVSLDRSANPFKGAPEHRTVTGKHGDVGHYTQIDGHVVFISEHAGHVPARVKSENPKRFTKAEVERALLDHHKATGEVWGPEHDKELERLNLGGDPWTFKGKLPREIQQLREGRPELMSLLKTTEGRGGGGDAFAALGDRYEHLAELRAGSPLKAALKTAKDSNDPEMQYLAHVHANLPKRGDGEVRKLDAKGLRVGDRFTVGGVAHRVAEDEHGLRVLKHGHDYETPLDALEYGVLKGQIPHDKGSFKPGRHRNSAKAIDTGEDIPFSREVCFDRDRGVFLARTLFDEHLHPRDADGKWAEKGASGDQRPLYDPHQGGWVMVRHEHVPTRPAAKPGRGVSPDAPPPAVEPEKPFVPQVTPDRPKPHAAPKMTDPRAEKSKGYQHETAGAAAKAGKSYGDWRERIQRAFVNEDINDDHPAYAQAFGPSGQGSVDGRRHNASADLFGKHVRTSTGHFGTVIDVDDDAGAVTVGHDDGGFSRHDPIGLDDAYSDLKYRAGSGRDISDHLAYLAPKLAAEAIGKNENISETMKRHGIPLMTPGARGAISAELTKQRPPAMPTPTARPTPDSLQVTAADASAIKPDLFGNRSIDGSGVGKQAGMFGEPEPAKPAEKPLGSKNANDPRHTAEMFPAAGSIEAKKREVERLASKAAAAQANMADDRRKHGRWDSKADRLESAGTTRSSVRDAKSRISQLQEEIGEKYHVGTDTWSGGKAPSARPVGDDEPFNPADHFYPDEIPNVKFDKAAKKFVVESPYPNDDFYLPTQAESDARYAARRAEKRAAHWTDPKHVRVGGKTFDYVGALKYNGFRYHPEHKAWSGPRHAMPYGVPVGTHEVDVAGKKIAGSEGKERVHAKVRVVNTSSNIEPLKAHGFKYDSATKTWVGELRKLLSVTHGGGVYPVDESRRPIKAPPHPQSDPFGGPTPERKRQPKPSPGLIGPRGNFPDRYKTREFRKEQRGDYGYFSRDDAASPGVSLSTRTVGNPVQVPAALEGRETTDKDTGEPVTWWWKTAVVAGHYHHPQLRKGDVDPSVRLGRDELYEFDVTPARIDGWVRTFKKMQAKGIRVPVLAGHSTHPSNALGTVEEMRRDGDKLRILHRLVGRDAALAAERNCSSVNFNRFVDAATGDVYPDAICHQAITPTPVLPNLGKFERADPPEYVLAA